MDDQIKQLQERSGLLDAQIHEKRARYEKVNHILNEAEGNYGKIVDSMEVLLSVLQKDHQQTWAKNVNNIFIWEQKTKTFIFQNLLINFQNALNILFSTT